MTTWQLMEDEAWNLPNVKQIVVIVLSVTLVLAFHKHNSLPLGQIRDLHLLLLKSSMKYALKMVVSKV